MSILDNLPNIPPEVWAISWVVAGFCVGLIIRIICIQVAERIRKAQDSPIKSLEMALRRAGPIALWTFVFVGVAIAFRVLEPQADEDSILNQIRNDIPNYILCGIIVLIAHLIGVAIRDFIQRTISETRLASTLGVLGYGSIFFIGLIVGLGQVGVDVRFLGIAMIVILGIMIGSVGITIGIGSRHHIANLVARQELAELTVGDRLRVQGAEGTIVEIRRTRVKLITPEGTTVIPASRFIQEPYSILSSDE